MLVAVAVFLGSLAMSITSAISSFRVASDFDTGNKISVAADGPRAAAWVRTWAPLILAVDLVLVFLSPVTEASRVPAALPTLFLVVLLTDVALKLLNGVALVHWSPRSKRTWQVVIFYAFTLGAFAFAAFVRTH